MGSVLPAATSPSYTGADLWLLPLALHALQGLEPPTASPLLPLLQSSCRCHT